MPENGRDSSDFVRLRLRLRDADRPLHGNTLPAVCEECREFIAADYYNPRCPLCGIRPIFYGDTEHKYDGFALYEEKHMRLKGTDHPFSLHIDRALARPNASNRYWCPRCGRKELRFVYTGFRE